MMNQCGLNTSRWLDAIWKPNAQINTLPNGIDMLDLTGDDDDKLIIIDLGNEAIDDVKLKIFKGADQMRELIVVNTPCSIVGFYTENTKKKSAIFAVAMSSCIFIFKYLRAHFQFCLPQLTITAKEEDIWNKASINLELNTLNIIQDLKQLLKENGISSITPRTLNFLSLEKEFQNNFVKEFRKFPVIKANIVTIIGIIRKDSLSEISSSNLIVGTEFGELLILDPRSFFIIQKYIIGWPPVAIASFGVWASDGQIVLVGRDGKIGTAKRGNIFEMWENLSAPAVTITSLCSEEIAIITMNCWFHLYSNQGVKLWKIYLPGIPLDMVHFPLLKSGSSFLAISIVGFGVRIYDQKHHIDTMNIFESVSSLKYGRLGQEECTMVMITCSGGLNIKILKRTAEFTQNSCLEPNFNLFNNINKFIIPKKNKLFIEQSMREKLKFTKIHKIFQQGFLRLRLNISTKIKKLQTMKFPCGMAPITLHSTIFGFGPNYVIKIYIISMLETFLNGKMFLIYRCDHLLMKPKIINLPCLTTVISTPIILSVKVNCILLNKIQLLLCYEGQTKPLIVANINIPVTLDEIKI